MTSPTFCSWFYRKSQVVKAKEFYVLLTKQADGIFSHSACSVVKGSKYMYLDNLLYHIIT